MLNNCAPCAVGKHTAICDYVMNVLITRTKSKRRTDSPNTSSVWTTTSKKDGELELGLTFSFKKTLKLRLL